VRDAEVEGLMWGLARAVRRSLTTALDGCEAGATRLAPPFQRRRPGHGRLPPPARVGSRRLAAARRGEPGLDPIPVETAGGPPALGAAEPVGATTGRGTSGRGAG